MNSCSERVKVLVVEKRADEAKDKTKAEIHELMKKTLREFREYIRLLNQRLTAHN